jgi:hypothetical protein
VYGTVSYRRTDRRAAAPSAGTNSLGARVASVDSLHWQGDMDHQQRCTAPNRAGTGGNSRSVLSLLHSHLMPVPVQRAEPCTGASQASASGSAGGKYVHDRYSLVVRSCRTSRLSFELILRTAWGGSSYMCRQLADEYACWRTRVVQRHHHRG